jgi:hypothetical protein
VNEPTKVEVIGRVLNIKDEELARFMLEKFEELGWTIAKINEDAFMYCPKCGALAQPPACGHEKALAAHIEEEARLADEIEALREELVHHGHVFHQHLFTKLSNPPSCEICGKMASE